jgi:hypothetical protein
MEDSVKTSFSFAESAGVWCTVVALVIGAAFIGWVGDGVGALLFGVTIALWPLGISLSLALNWRGRRKAQAVLAAGSALFGAGFTWMCVEVFFLHPDAQSAFLLLFVGFYSLPLMIPAWIVAWRLAKAEAGRGE